MARGTDPIGARDAKEVSTEHVGYDVRGGVARVTLARPEALNSYSTAALVALTDAMTSAARDDSVGVIVLTGAGERAFCTGGDVKEYAERFVRRPRDYWKYMGVFRAAVESILRSGKPTIARLNGIAVGGGNELHLACDISIAAEHAYLGQVGVGVGSVACGGATQWLPLAVGDRRARAMLLLNERVPARLAEEWGLVYRAVPSVARDGTLLERPPPEAIAKALKRAEGHAIDLGPLDRAVDETAQRLLGMFPECLRYTKEQVNYWKEMAWNDTVGHGREWLALHFAALEPFEGMTAFAEKRAPDVAGIRARLAAGGPAESVHGPPARRCAACGARGLPEEFAFCGRCGKSL